MDPYYELAYALESKSLCLFVGTGFSMHITNGKAPNWLELLQKCCKKIADGDELSEQLFPDGKPIMPLEECASVIKVKMDVQGKCLHTEISKIIKKVKVGSNAKVTKDFLNKFPYLKAITTNYDLLFESELLDKDMSTSYSSGYPVSRQPKGVEIYHMHGSIKYPSKMVVTAEDYFRFINKPDYFSSKVQTLIEENTTIIMGYSLGDINFKSILNKLRTNRQHDINRQHLFFLSRSKVDGLLKDYYDRTYGLRVIDETDIDIFIKNISKKHKLIKDRVSKSRALLIPVLEGTQKFTDSYLKKRESFFEILSTLSSNGIIVSHSNVVKFLKDVLKRKRGFTGESGAWNQYVHLASWLVQLGAIMDISETPLEEIYLAAVEKSFDNMSKRQVLGLSWESFNIWKQGWQHLTYQNRVMICSYVKDKNLSEDVDEVIEQ